MEEWPCPCGNWSSARVSGQESQGKFDRKGCKGKHDEKGKGKGGKHDKKGKHDKDGKDKEH